ncbi:MAG: maleylpyruvate isomerase family mycothiol-dependent enzyme, partial [Candidatus Dormibacteria bacterium]
MASSPWPLIHAERKALAEDLRQLAESQWATQSLCSDWTIRDALAHMTATAKMTPPRFFGKFMASGFRFDAMSAKDVAAERGSSGADALARFTAMLDATTHPPGPVEAMVGEAVVHSEDIRRPLGIHHRYSDEALTRTADFYRSSNLLIGAKRRADGLTLRA